MNTLCILCIICNAAERFCCAFLSNVAFVDWTEKPQLISSTKQHSCSPAGTNKAKQWLFCTTQDSISLNPKPQTSHPRLTDHSYLNQIHTRVSCLQRSNTVSERFLAKPGKIFRRPTATYRKTKEKRRSELTQVMKRLSGHAVFPH